MNAPFVLPLTHGKKAALLLFCGLCGSFPCKELPRLLNWNPNAAEHLAALAEQYRQQAE